MISSDSIIVDDMPRVADHRAPGLGFQEFGEQAMTVQPIQHLVQVGHMRVPVWVINKDAIEKDKYKFPKYLPKDHVHQGLERWRRVCQAERHN